MFEGHYFSLHLPCFRLRGGSCPRCPEWWRTSWSAWTTGQDSLYFCNFSKDANTKLFWTLTQNRFLSSLQNEWGEQICWLRIPPGSSTSPTGCTETWGSTTSLTPGALIAKNVKRLLIDPAKQSGTSYSSLMVRNPKLTGQIFFGGLIQAGGPVKVVEDKEMSVQPQVQMTITCLRKDTIMILPSDPICKRQEDWGRPTDVAGNVFARVMESATDHLQLSKHCIFVLVYRL